MTTSQLDPRRELMEHVSGLNQKEVLGVWEAIYDFQEFQEYRTDQIIAFANQTGLTIDYLEMLTRGLERSAFDQLCINLAYLNKNKTIFRVPPGSRSMLLV